MAEVNKSNRTEFEIIRAIAASGEDKPVLMLNMNRYTQEAGFPDGDLYNAYMSGLEKFVVVTGGKIIWRHAVLGQALGDQQVHEVLGAWFPTHQAWLDMIRAPGAEENFRLRGLAVEYAVIHRFPGDVHPFIPHS